MAQNFFLFSEEPNFTDEELEDLQNLLWRGYQPEPYQRHDLDLYSPLDHPIWRRHVTPAERKAAETEKAERYAERERELAQFRAGVRARERTVEQYSEFRCDECKRTFRSVSDAAEIDQDYWDRFGPAATQERLAVCENCFNELMRGYGT